MSAAFQIEGLKEARKAFRLAADKQALDAVKDAHKTVAEKVVKHALPHVPVRSGLLRASVRALASQASGRVKAGTRVRVPYAAPVHWGWPAHGIRRNPFLLNALDDVSRGAENDFLRAFSDNVDLIDRSPL